MAKSDPAGMKLVLGDLGLSSRSPRQCKVTPVELRENELEGKPLDRYRIEDMGSHKVIALERANGVSAFRCSYMEGEMR